MKKITLTCAHAIVKYLIAQKILINGKKEPLFPGVFGIFGHGNVACLGQALEESKKELPTYRGHHEQNMALTGIGYARAKRRQQIFVATSSVGPGATNMVTAVTIFVAPGPTEDVATKICCRLFALAYPIPVRAIFCSWCPLYVGSSFLLSSSA